MSYLAMHMSDGRVKAPTSLAFGVLAVVALAVHRFIGANGPVRGNG